MKDEKIVEIDDYRLELENRIRNLLWTISGDYSLNMKVDVSLYLRSKAIALYDGIKQGALAKYFDKDLLGMYLVKKVFCQASEGELTVIAQLCVEEAIGEKICEERPGVREMQKKAFEDILDQEFERMPAYGDILGRLKIAILRDRLSGGNHQVEERLRKIRDVVYQAREVADTMELIRVIDQLYNTIIDPEFEKLHGSLTQVMAVTMEELTEYNWEDFLTEELYEEALESYIEQMILVNELVAKKLYMMPIYESPSIIDLRNRIDILYLLRDSLARIEDLILNIRVGGNDLCHMFGFRRHANESIHSIRPVSDIFSDIITVYGMDYVISGPVWEYYAGDSWKEGLIQEIREDRLCGFIGKTVIHPSQIPVVNRAYQVSRNDYLDARAILNWNADSASLVAGSKTRERMNEYKTHLNWAKKTVYLSEVFGITE